MGFFEKLRRSLAKIKGRLILYIVVIIVADFALVAPITRAFTDAVNVASDTGNMNDGITEFFYDLAYIAKPGENILTVFTANYFHNFITASIWFFIFAFIFAIVGIIKAMPKHEFTDIENGSSDWSEGEQYKILSKKEGIVLAEKNYLPVNKRGNVNVLVVGGSGAGKSASYVIPNALQLLGSYVFTDPKGELYDKTAGYFMEKGYDVKVLNLVNPENSDGYNPLSHIKNEIDVDVIANTIVKGQSDGSQSSDPYWDNMAEMLLKALIYYLKAVRPPEEQNLASCSEIVRAANASGGSNKLSELMETLPPGHPARDNYKSVSIASDKTYSSILSTLQSKLGKFDSKEIAEVTSTDSIDFDQIGAKKTVVYVISSDTHTAYDFLLTIFFSQMIQQMYDFADKNGGALPVPTYFILDEFANIGHIPDFDKKISTSRSRKISFSVILQNLDQLEAVYEKAYETIIGNCDTHLFLGSNSQKTVEYFSKQLGEKTITRNNYSTNRDVGEWKTGSSESDQIMARALMTPDELRRMDVDQCIIFVKGLKPIKANKYYYFKYPEAKYVENYPANHNDVTVQRTEWRRYNPNNPYDEGEEERGDYPSLDSLFEEEQNNNDVSNAFNELDELDAGNSASASESPEVKTKESSINDIDIQKELEAKFDELFGALQDDES